MRTPACRGPAFELREQAAADPEPTRRVGDPHPLQLGGLLAVELQRAAADRLGMERRDEEEARRRPQLVQLGRDAAGGIEAGLEAAAELRHVRVQAGLGLGPGRVDDLDADERRGEQPLDVSHRRDELLLLALAERREEGPRELVAAALEHTQLPAPGGGELRGADAAVGRARLHGDQPVALERLQEPAQVAGVEVEPRAQVAQVGARLPDLPEHARLAERPVAREVVVVERSDPLRHEPVEAPDASDGLGGHSLILVR